MSLPKSSSSDSDAAESGQLVVVLGMHRSGTSVLTRSLQVLGVELGTDLMPSKEDNPKGFWEDAQINSLNIEMLGQLGIDWHYLSIIEPNHVEQLRHLGFFIRATELIKSRLSPKTIFGLKDPRIAQLLPFWKQVFDHCKAAVRYVLTVRNPRSVARSLEVRNGLSAEQGYAVWLTHVLASLLWTRSDDRTIVDYDLFVEDPRSQLDRMSTNLGLEIDEVELEAFLADFFDPGLRHFGDDIADLRIDRACLPLAIEVFEGVRKVASGGAVDDRKFQRSVARWHRELVRQSPLRTMFDRQSRQAMEMKATIESQDDKLGRLQQVESQNVTANEYISDLKARVSALSSQLEDVAALVADRETEMVRLSEVIGDRDAELARRSDLITDQAAAFKRQETVVEVQADSIRDQHLRLESMSLRLDELSRSLHETQVVSQGRAERLRQTETEVAAIRQSTSWRVTAPMRWLVTALDALRTGAKRGS